jgi:RNA polymerase sigma factor (sigma-70 family)
MGARKRFEDIIGEHQAMVARICAGHEADRDLARDLVQDVLVAVWKALPAFRGESSTKTFVARIAQFRAISHAVRGARLPDLAELDEELTAPGPAPDQQIIAADQRARLLTAVRRLPIVYREPVILTLEDFTPAEIAEVLGLRASVVSVRLTRARAMLRAWLGEES